MDTKIEYKGLPKDSKLMPVIEQVRKFALASLSQKRYEHSFRVAETAQKICTLYGVDPARGFLAGIGHDMCKEMSDELLLSLASHDGFPITEIEKKKPSLLHGRAAAVKMHDDFGINDNELLEAVAYHTFGKKNFGSLGKIVYSADKIEPGRENITSDYLKKLFSLDLNKLTKIVLKDCIAYVKKKDRPVAPESEEFLASLKKEIKKQKKMEKQEGSNAS